MKVEIRKDIDIKNKEMANKCYNDFIERMLDTITDTLGFVYDIEYDSAKQASYNLPKEDFLEILKAFQDLVEKDTHWP